MAKWRLRTATIVAGSLTLVFTAVTACNSSRKPDNGGVVVPAAAGSVAPAALAPSSAPAPSSPTPITRHPMESASRPSSQPPTTKPSGPAYPYGARRTTGTSAVALTFDDGPTWTWTEQMLAVLRKHNVKATFCVLGKMARTYPNRIRQIAAEGHTLCNHTYDHNVKLGTLSEAEIRANLQATNDAIRAAVPDAKISYFRHPGGAWTPLAVKVAADLGMTSLHWTVDPRDYTRPGAQAIADYVMSHTRPGSIVLLHDGGGDRSQTVAACDRILPALKSQFTLIALPPRPAP